MSPTPGLPLALNSEGEAVADVRQRLAELGFDTAVDPPGRFGTATRAAIEAFQRQRGLRIDGICGPNTWSTLVEAGYALGDRFLYRRRSMFRGDDVAELQRRLCALGFDTGRVDGIFGDQTEAALREFQRNCGLPTDGILGIQTVAELRRVEQRASDPLLVSIIRDEERLRQQPPTLTNRHIAIGDTGAMATIAVGLSRKLAAQGAQVSVITNPNESIQAREANAAGVDVFVGLRLLDGDTGCRTAYYSGYSYVSPGGRLLAQLIFSAIPKDLLDPQAACEGMSYAVLRETQMTAVVAEIGPPRTIVERGPVLIGALSDAFSQWAAESGSSETLF